MVVTEQMTPEEYDTLVELSERAERIAEARLAAYVKATGGSKPNYTRDLTFRFKSRSPSRVGRDKLGRYDIVITYIDFDGETSEVYLPSAILWDPEGITAAVVADQAAVLAEYEAADAARHAAARTEIEKKELARARATLRRHGYRAVKEES